jgi:hypothetical protein
VSHTLDVDFNEPILIVRIPNRKFIDEDSIQSLQKSLFMMNSFLEDPDLMVSFLRSISTMRQTESAGMSSLPMPRRQDEAKSGLASSDQMITKTALPKVAPPPMPPGSPSKGIIGLSNSNINSNHQPGIQIPTHETSGTNGIQRSLIPIERDSMQSESSMTAGQSRNKHDPSESDNYSGLHPAAPLLPPDQASALNKSRRKDGEIPRATDPKEQSQMRPKPPPPPLPAGAGKMQVRPRPAPRVNTVQTRGAGLSLTRLDTVKPEGVSGLKSASMLTPSRTSPLSALDRDELRKRGQAALVQLRSKGSTDDRKRLIEEGRQLLRLARANTPALTPPAGQSSRPRPVPPPPPPMPPSRSLNKESHIHVVHPTHPPPETPAQSADEDEAGSENSAWDFDDFDDM